MSSTTALDIVVVLAVGFAVAMSTVAPVAATGLTEDADATSVGDTLDSDSSVTDSEANGTESGSNETDSGDSSSDSEDSGTDGGDSGADPSGETGNHSNTTTSSGSGGDADDGTDGTTDASANPSDEAVDVIALPDGSTLNDGYDPTTSGSLTGTLTEGSHSDATTTDGDAADETTSAVRRAVESVDSTDDGSLVFDEGGDLLGGPTQILETADTFVTSWEQSAAGMPADGAGDSAGDGTDDGADGGLLAALPMDGTDAPVPGMPTSGAAVGVGAVAAAAAARSGTLPGVTTGLGATLSAALAPMTVQGSGLSERLFRLFAPLRYSRYDDSDPLEHEARKEVFEIVEERPGAYLSEIATRASLPLSTTRHHVRVLEREDLVSGAKVRGKRRFYPAHSTSIELTAAMNDEATAVVLDALARLGAASVSDVADELGRDPSTVSHHLQRLADDGIIVREREGRAVVSRLAQEARAVLQPEPAVEKIPAEGALVGGD